MQGNRDLLGLESHPRASRPRGLLILSMGEGVRHLVPQSAKEAHSRRGEATKGLEDRILLRHLLVPNGFLPTPLISKRENMQILRKLSMQSEERESNIELTN